MPTFVELLRTVEVAQQKLVILKYLVDHIDLNFRPIAGADPKQKLLDDKNIAIKPEMFEAVINDVLMKSSEELAHEVAAINNTPLTTQEQPKKGKASK